MTVNKERLQLGLDALRSGQYEQGIGTLCRVTDGTVKYCCLGVLTDVAIKNGLEGIVVDDEADAIGYRFGSRDYVEYTVLHEEVMNWYGLEDNNPQLLTLEYGREEAAMLNDNFGLEFVEIADAFEATYMNEES